MIESMHGLFLFPTAVRRDPAVDDWMAAQPAELRAIAEYWFAVIRDCGPDVRELLHDGHPTGCAGDAAFAYVNAFTSHVNVGFFKGSELADPQKLLTGSGKSMRHVKIRPGIAINEDALRALIEEAYLDMKSRLAG